MHAGGVGYVKTVLSAQFFCNLTTKKLLCNFVFSHIIMQIIYYLIYYMIYNYIFKIFKYYMYKNYAKKETYFNQSASQYIDSSLWVGDWNFSQLVNGEVCFHLRLFQACHLSQLIYSSLWSWKVDHVSAPPSKGGDWNPESLLKAPQPVSCQYSHPGIQASGSQGVTSDRGAQSLP